MIKSRFTLKQLEAFAFVVDLGTFRAAAEALGTTQPNISARIAALEATLGATLLQRDAGSVRLTAEGEALLDNAREVLWAGEALLEAAGRRDSVTERLRLGVTELVACTWLQPFLKRLRAEYPQLKIELQVDLSAKIDDLLGAGMLDLALPNTPFSRKVSAQIALGRVPYVWAERVEGAAQARVRKSVEQLFEQPVLTHARETQAGISLHDMARQRGLDVGQIVHSSALSACLPMLHEGVGVALLPRPLVQGDLDRGELRLIEVDWAPPELEFYARYHADRAARFVGRAAEIAAEVFAAS